MGLSNCDCGFDIGDPRVFRHLDSCSSIRLPLLEARIAELEAENAELKCEWIKELRKNMALREAGYGLDN